MWQRMMISMTKILINLSWSLSTQETMLNRWIVPTIASASKLRLTIPIKVGLP